ncbi:NTP transferase domain-containing protein, partial [Candidatus Gracilibacteria bacterium]|nr:NTP transferase domain-containing protein [Candidatus Gracilibacteria bacterium]
MKAIILAAGEGTRLRPLTLEVPKAMVEIFGKPLLAHNMDKLLSHVDEFTIVVKYKEEIVREYFGKSYKGIPIKYHTQKDKKGTAGALEGINIKGDCFILASDAIFYQSDIDRLMGLQGYGVLAKQVADPQKYGIFQINTYNILQKVIEKPQENIGNLASLFYFKVNSEIIRYTEKIKKSERGEYELTDALNLFVAKYEVFVQEIQ